MHPSPAKTQRTSAKLARPKRRSSASKRGHQPILDEERIYAYVLPFVRIFQGLWLVTAVFIVFYLYRWFRGTVLVGGFASLSTKLTLLIVLTALFLLASVAICRMSRVLGYITLAICCVFSLIWLVYAALIMTLIIMRIIAITGVIINGGIYTGGYGRLVVNITLVIVPAYLCYLGFKAGFTFAFSDVETKQIVSEMDPISRLPFGWLSKILAMPVPKETLTKNKALTSTLFILSGLAFSFFPFLAVFSLGRTLVQLIISRGRGTAPLIYSALALLVPLVGLAARRAGRRLMISSIRESTEHDKRAPLLFLRSFRDEHVKLSAPRILLLGRLVNLFQRKGTLDIVLLEEATAYGPVVAVGEPGEPVPPYGAARGYFADGDWQKAIAQLADASRCIVICLDQTEGLIWELDHILNSGHGGKTLFIMNPGARDLEKNKALLAEIFARIRNTTLQRLLTTDEPVLGFFFDEGQYAKVGVSRDFSEASYLLMVRWFLRTAMDGQLQPN